MPARRKRSLLPPGILGLSAVIIDSPRRREQLAAVAERLPAHVARLEWSQDQIKAERQRALRETLAFAKGIWSWRTPTFRAKPAAAEP